MSAAGVVFVGDVPKLAAFYQAVAGMVMLHADEQHIVLSISGFELTIHALPSSAPPSASYAAREDSYIKLCFPVADLKQARARAVALGGRLLPEEREWQARGFRACDGNDPEGNVFQLRQHVPD